MIFRQLFDSASGTYSYLLASRHGGEALIIDRNILSREEAAQQERMEKFLVYPT